MDYQFVSKMTLFHPIQPDEAYTFDPNEQQLLTPYVKHIQNQNELPNTDMCCDSKRPGMYQYATLLPEHEPFIQDPLIKQSIGKPIMGFINHDKTRGLLCNIEEECLPFENKEYIQCMKQKCKNSHMLTNYEFCRLSNMYGIPKEEFLFPEITSRDCKDTIYTSPFRGDTRPLEDVLTDKEIAQMQKEYLNTKMNIGGIEDEIKQVKTNTKYDISLQTVLLVIFGTFILGIILKTIKK
jgi:hypothetical protein